MSIIILRWKTLNVEKIRKDLAKADPEEITNYHSKSRVNKPNTPHGYSDKKRQTIEAAKLNQ